MNGIISKTSNGYLYECDFVQRENDNMKKKALRKIANKCALAIRCDVYNINKHSLSDINLIKEQTLSQASTVNEDGLFGIDYFDDVQLKNQEKMEKNVEEEGLYGIKLKETIESKLDKIKNSKQPVTIKPLPRPDDKPKKRRGGMKLKAFKESVAITDLLKKKMRLKFGEEAEKDYQYSGEGYGMIGVEGNTKIKIKKITKNGKK